ncbi:unnamed protein product [Darwinula stevensoni]|uniref:Serine aminopeptidase S33 domain-containing protein n=1 Tax=Darwinula stevensoni TaxID=69355 RepID=A0A7R9FQB1_9CRUS|nr:unnamed protein product [Darwinula stevensoni]CAG0899461.1 unnamed protein product [Darwinula stevensoni]
MEARGMASSGTTTSIFGDVFNAVTSKIASLFAFYPPPPSYNLRPSSSDTENIQEIFFREEAGQVCEKDEKERFEVGFANTSRGSRIVTLFIRCSDAGQRTIMLSHGNGEDLGLTAGFLLEMSDEFNFNVFSYDYSGYGRSTGKPSEDNLYADIEAAWEVLRTKHGVPEEKVVLYGRSLGTAPTVHLASKLTKLPGVILHSPLSSGMGMVLSSSWSLGPFPVAKSVPLIDSPVLVIHGTQDEVIPISHGRTVYERCRRAVIPLWVEGGGHNNIQVYPKYWERVEFFLTKELSGEWEPRTNVVL